MQDIQIQQLTKNRLNEAIDLVFNARLDSREEILHHLEHLDAHYVALENNKIIGVVGWYQDNVKYATEAMGGKFPGEDAYWVGFFAVDKNHRGKGIGYSLLQHIQDILKNKGVDKLWVSSVPETRNYYERQGFKLFMEGKISGNPKFFLVKDL